MTELAGGAIAMGVGALACGVALSRTLLRYREGAGTELVAEDSPTVSLSRYSVLKRLTGEEDEQFLRELPGFKAEMAKRLRRQRRAIVRMYLRELAGDFHSLHRAARRIVADAPEEHADLVGGLLRQQIRFWSCLAAIELRLALAPLGLPNVDTGRLLDVVEGLRAAVAGPEASPAAA
jgi:hypothetical protein